jgi:hypothetical protein
MSGRRDVDIELGATNGVSELGELDAILRLIRRLKIG